MNLTPQPNAWKMLVAKYRVLKPLPPLARSMLLQGKTPFYFLRRDHLLPAGVTPLILSLCPIAKALSSPPASHTLPFPLANATTTSNSLFSQTKASGLGLMIRWRRQEGGTIKLSLLRYIPLGESQIYLSPSLPSLPLMIHTRMPLPGLDEPFFLAVYVAVPSSSYRDHDFSLCCMLYQYLPISKRVPFWLSARGTSPVSMTRSEVFTVPHVFRAESVWNTRNSADSARNFDPLQHCFYMCNEA